MVRLTALAIGVDAGLRNLLSEGKQVATHRKTEKWKESQEKSQQARWNKLMRYREMPPSDGDTIDESGVLMGMRNLAQTLYDEQLDELSNICLVDQDYANELVERWEENGMADIVCLALDIPIEKQIAKMHQIVAEGADD